MNKNTVIFIGNGINRCFCDNDWENVLAYIANVYHVSYDPAQLFSLEFERLVLEILSRMKKPNENIYKEVKEVLTTWMQETYKHGNQLYEKILELPFSSVLTTNYDYAIELSLDSNLLYENGVKGKYSTTRYAQYEDYRIHHIHGELKRPSSICLGYEHYIGATTNLRDVVKKKLQSNIKNHDVHDEWAMYFFTHDVHIIGFGLDLSEVDIWWMLNYRAYILYGKGSVHFSIKNKIVFHSVVDTKREIDKVYENKKRLLKSFGVTVEETPLETTYKDAYLNIINSFE